MPPPFCGSIQAMKRGWLRLRYGRGDASELEEAHRHSSRHREEIEASRTCGCFYCLEVFRPEEIRRWVPDEGTALCPRCGDLIDAVIGSASGFPITQRFLARMHLHYF